MKNQNNEVEGLQLNQSLETDWTKYRLISDESKNALIVAKEFLQRFKDNPSNPAWLFIHGPSERGKTFLADLVWKEIRLLSSKCAKLKWVKVNSCSFEEFSQVVPHWDDARQFYLDDLLSCGNNLAVDRALTLLEVGCGKWGIITSNHSIAKLGEIDGRIASRIRRNRHLDKKFFIAFTDKTKPFYG